MQMAGSGPGGQPISQTSSMGFPSNQNVQYPGQHPQVQPHQSQMYPPPGPTPGSYQSLPANQQGMHPPPHQYSSQQQVSNCTFLILFLMII
jgi:hypothetical protein